MIYTLYDYKGFLYLGGSTEKDIYYKKINGKWDRVQCAWRFHPIFFTVEYLMDLHGDNLEITSPVAWELINEEWGFGKQDVIVPEETQPFYNNLRDYQKEGVTYLLSQPDCVGLLGFTPRLGKTPTSIVAAQCVDDVKNVLVICPYILIPGWIKEFGKWSNWEVENTHQSLPDARYDVNVTNYETIVKYEKQYAKVKWDVIIVDESLMVKNFRANSKKTSQRAKAVSGVKNKNVCIWLLSGGPVSNYADDLFGQFRVMLPKVFSSYWKFAEYNCEIERSVHSTAGIYGGKVIATKPNVDIRKRYKDLLFIRNMAEVLDQIPEHIVQNVFLDMKPTQRKIYDATADDMMIQVRENGLTELGEIINELESGIRLQQACSNPVNFCSNNVSIKTDYILNAITNNEVELPIVIWGHWRETLITLNDALKARFPHLRIGLVMGGTKDSGQYALDFKDGFYDILIVSIEAGKYGLNLSNARTVFSYDRIWIGDSMFQSTFRTLEPGMDHKPVWINLITKSTVDEGIFKVLDPKFESIENVMGVSIGEFIRGR